MAHKKELVVLHPRDPTSWESNGMGVKVFWLETWSTVSGTLTQVTMSVVAVMIPSCPHRRRGDIWEKGKTRKKVYSVADAPVVSAEVDSILLKKRL